MKKNLFKTWLVAIIAMMGAGTGWAQTVTTYDFEDGNALFTADSRVSVNVVEGTQTIYNESFELDGKAVSFKGASNAQNGYCFAHYDFSALCEQAAKVKVEFDAVLGNGARSIISVGDASVRGTTGNSSKTTYSNKGAIFRVGTDKSNSYVNAGNVGNSTVVSQKWLKVTVEVDETEKTYTYSIENKATGDILYSNGDDPITFYSSDATNCTQIDMFGYINNSQMGLIDNLVITVTQDERPQAEYTVKYVNEYGTEIKDPSTRSGAVGDAITLLPADFETFKTSDGTNKYFYNSDDSEGKTIASDGSTIITITYREAETWSWTVNFIVGETILGTKTGTVFEGDQAIVPYPKYQENAGQLYIKDKGLSTANEFNYKFTPNGNAELKTIEYAIVDGVTNVVYCSEAEDIEGMTLCTSGNAGIRSSNSAAAYATQDVTFTTLPAGKYNMYVSLFDATKNHDSSWTIKAGAIDAATIDCAGINFTEYPTNEFAIGKETPIIIAKGGSDNIGVDAIYIVKTGEVTPEEAAELNQAADLAAAKADLQATIDEAKNIDTTDKEGVAELNDAIAAAEAAVAAADATLETIAAAKAALEEAVQAFYLANAPKYGIIWQGEVALAPDSYVTVSTIAIKGIPAKVNDTIRVTVALPLEARAVNKVITKAPEFSVVASLDAEAPLWDKVTEFGEGAQSFDFIVKETQLEALKAVDAFYIVGKELSVTKVELIDGKGTVGIATVENTRQTSNQIYNLAGQKVTKAQKGLFIINGKKVVK